MPTWAADSVFSEQCPYSHGAAAHSWMSASPRAPLSAPSLVGAPPRPARAVCAQKHGHGRTLARVVRGEPVPRVTGAAVVVLGALGKRRELAVLAGAGVLCDTRANGVSGAGSVDRMSLRG